MRTLHQHVRPSWIAGLACTLAAGCMQQPIASNLRPAPLTLANAPVAVGYAQPASNAGATGSPVDFPSGGTGRYASVEEMLAARVAGLEVLRRGDGRFSLRVRGSGAGIGGGDPLIVVDGVSMNGNAADVLAGLSPGDVRHVEVLKDISSTAIHGNRGVNGVVVITTRRWR